MKVEFLEITEQDLEIIREIYDYYIAHTTATYYTERISVDELKGFIPIHDQKYKTFLIKANNESCGFCYFGQYKKRQAYDRTAEISVYIKPGFTGKGIGKEALQYLETVARNKGVSVLIAIISGDNEISIKLFKRNGFEKCGHYKQIGEKFNKVLDVVSYQKIIR